MNAPAKMQSPPARCARWILDCALRHWPEDTRPWGLALAAEIDETANAFETVRWSLGGLMFFGRSVLSSALAWLKLPAGASLSGSPSGGPLDSSTFPKRSRFFTAAVLLAAALLLILPQGREALRTVRGTWQNDVQSESDARKLEELATRAEKDKDADMLAFAALSARDSTRGAALTERAIALDPKLIWVYGARNHSQKNDPPREDRLAQLQLADPGNAVPDLLMADALVQPQISILIEHGMNDREYRLSLESNAKWMALMERAYAEPRYDSYFQRHYHLTKTVWNREKDLPATIVLYGVAQHAFPDLLHIRMYCDMKIDAARKAREAGNFTTAKDLLAGVDAFGVRMADSGGADFEQLIGLVVSRSANKEAENLAKVSANPEDARTAAARLDQIEARFNRIRRSANPERAVRSEVFRKEGLLVQSFGILCVLAAIGTLAGILLLELWPARLQGAKSLSRRFACILADWAPPTLLVACAGFLLSFLPFHRAIEEYRSSNYLRADELALLDAWWGLMRVTESLYLGADATVRFWYFVTVALSAVLLAVVFRAIVRTKRSATNPA